MVQLYVLTIDGKGSNRGDELTGQKSEEHEARQEKWVDHLAMEAEEAARSGRIKEV